MSHQIWIRPYDEKKDCRLLAEWLYASRHQNRFDPELFKNKQVQIFVAFNNEEVVGFIPVRLAYIAESLAFKPGISPITEAKALLAWQHVMANKCYEGKVADMFFVTFEPDVLKLAGQHGWKEVVVPMLNLHLADLEPKQKETPDGGTVSGS